MRRALKAVLTLCVRSRSRALAAARCRPLPPAAALRRLLCLLPAAGGCPEPTATAPPPAFMEPPPALLHHDFYARSLLAAALSRGPLHLSLPGASARLPRREPVPLSCPGERETLASLGLAPGPRHWDAAGSDPDRAVSTWLWVCPQGTAPALAVR